MGTSVSLWIFARGRATDKIVGAFLAFVSLMQGIEYLLWKHQVCDDTHKAISITGMILNHAQPLVLGGLLLAFSRPPTTILYGLLALYVIIIVPYSLQYIASTDVCTEKRCESPHLFWKWNSMPHNMPVYALFLFILTALGLMLPEEGRFIAVSTVLLFASSSVLYPRPFVGAMWCLYGAVFPIVFAAKRGLLFSK